MRKLSKKQKAYQVRRKQGLDKRRIRSKEKRKDTHLRQISGEDS